MNRTPALGLSLRRAPFATQSIFRHQLGLRTVNQRRAIQVQSLPPSTSDEILNARRLQRPSSPHFTIYQPQLTWVGSIANRFTGAGLSVTLYAFSIGYVLAPYFGIPFDSGHIVEFVRELPEWAKYSGKVIFAAPFAFHSWNGLRHLAWDTGRFLSVKAAYATGYAVLGATAVTTAALVLL